MSDTSKRELIEEARAGLGAFDEYWGAGGPVDAAYGRPWELIRRLLAVIEQAHTPPDDERADLDDLEAMIEGAYDLRHVPVYPVRAIIRELRFRRTVQGEPTDAEVHAGAVAIDPAAWEPGIFYWQASSARDNSLELARTALRAAYETRGEGR